MNEALNTETMKTASKELNANWNKQRELTAKIEEIESQLWELKKEESELLKRHGR